MEFSETRTLFGKLRVSVMFDRRISIAPMMDCTDRHDRYFMRLIAPHVVLYTEMVTANAIIHGDRQKLLGFDGEEHPIVLQLGGSEPDKLAECARIGLEYGYDEINLNVGCPSDRVQSGRFGACLMLEPNLVAECVAAMAHSVTIPVTVKCRIGVDHSDSYDELRKFVTTVSQAGCHTFIIHARKAWLDGLSPKQNREIPPLRYDVVRQIKSEFPDLTIIINGGIKTVAEIEDHLQWVDGVMIGREAYSNPYLLAEIEKTFFCHEPNNVLTRHEVIERFLPYVHEQLSKNIKLTSITRHLFGLFHGLHGARLWRRYLSENAYKSGAGIDVIQRALELV